jgi:outer membrane protein
MRQCISVILMASVCALPATALPKSAKSPAAKKAPAQKKPTPDKKSPLDLPLVPYVPQSHEAEMPPAIELPPPTVWPEGLPRLKPLTADEAAKLAIFHQGNVTISQLQIDAAQGVTRQSQAPLGPSLNVSTSYSDRLVSVSPNGGGQNGGIISGGVNVANPYTISAALRQMLFDFNNTRNLVAQNRELESAAAFNYTQAQYDTAFNVKLAFYSWVQASRLIEVFTSNLDAQRQHLDSARGRYAQGVGLASDITRAQTTVSEAVLNVTQSQVNATVARTNLTNAMGLDPRIPLEAAESHETSAALDNPQALYDIAIQQRPELAAAEAVLRSNDFALKAAHTSNAPTVTATVQYVAFGASLYPVGTTVNFLVGVSWNPFDGGLKAGRVKQSEANQAIARSQLQISKTRVLTEVAQAYVNLRAAEQRVITVQSELASAQETVKITSGRYKAGIGLFLDVVDAQAAALTARVNQVNAQSALEQARVTLNHALGVPLAEADRTKLSSKASEPAPVVGK